MPYCQHCGTELAGAPDYCPACGEQEPTSAQAQTSAPPLESTASPAQPTDTGLSGADRALRVGAVGLGAVGTVVTVWKVLHGEGFAALVLDVLLQPVFWVAIVLAIWADFRARRSTAPAHSLAIVLGLVVAGLFLGLALSSMAPQGSGIGATSGQQTAATTSMPRAYPTLSEHLGGVQAAKGKVFLGSTADQVVKVLGEPESAGVPNNWYGVNGWSYKDAQGREALELNVVDGTVRGWFAWSSKRLSKLGAGVKKHPGEVAIGDSVTMALEKMGTPGIADAPTQTDGKSYNGRFAYFSNVDSSKRVVLKQIQFFNGVVVGIR